MRKEDVGKVSLALLLLLSSLGSEKEEMLHCTLLQKLNCTDLTLHQTRVR